MKNLSHYALLLGVAFVAIAGSPVASANAEAVADPEPTLRGAAEGHFLIGTAAMASQLGNQAMAELVVQEFNVLTPENEMKPDQLHPRKGEYDWRQADAIVEFAEKHDMQVIGHTLVWHQQSPKFLFEDEAGQPLPRDEALANMKEHIQTIVGRYKGRIHGWDVVNEAIDDAGPYLRDTPALRAIGEDYIAKAFAYAGGRP